MIPTTSTLERFSIKPASKVVMFRVTTILSNTKRNLSVSATLRLTNSTKPAPTVLIVPDDLDIPGLYLFPPVLKLIARNIKRRRRDQMVKDDVVLFAPAERGKMIQ